MGMDMYLYATGPNYRRMRELAKERAKEFNYFAFLLLEEDRYVGLKDVNRLTLIDKKGADKEKRELLANYKRELVAKAHSMEGICRRNLNYCYIHPAEYADKVNEIGYWDKEVHLHEFIIKNFGNPKDDNLKEVYLDETALNQIIETYPSEEAFKIALYIVKGGGVVFYIAWY